MAEGETFKASVIMQGSLGTAVVFDFGYVDLSSGTGHVETNTAAGDFQTLVQAKLSAALPDGVSFVKYRFACVGGTHKGEIGYVDVSPTVTGQLDSAGTLPMEMCISLKRSTGYASRRDRGRVFFGPVAGVYRNTGNVDMCDPDTALNNVRDLLKSDLTTSTRVLKPVILAADGTYSGRVVIRTSIGQTFIHRRTRRFRIGV